MRDMETLRAFSESHRRGDGDIREREQALLKVSGVKRANVVNIMTAKLSCNKER